ncbi:MAG: glycine zipper domain-containing protein [Putridiphycobacter sp.]|nr:glycine zipper domain-containing protein [Putridiphycobacter sp.]
MDKAQKILSVLIVLSAFSTNKSISQNNNGISQSLGLYVFPSNNQSPEQQATDESECFTWAKNQTGVDPLNPPKVEAKQAETGPDGSAIVGATGGAAAGAAIGAIAGDAGEGAAIGAVVGGLRGRRAAKIQQQKQQTANNQAATASEKTAMDNYKKAFTACMEGKGYTVK